MKNEENHGRTNQHGLVVRCSSLQTYVPVLQASCQTSSGKCYLVTATDSHPAASPVLSALLCPHHYSAFEELLYQIRHSFVLYRFPRPFYQQCVIHRIEIFPQVLVCSPDVPFLVTAFRALSRLTGVLSRLEPVTAVRKGRPNTGCKTCTSPCLQQRSYRTIWSFTAGILGCHLLLSGFGIPSLLTGAGLYHPSQCSSPVPGTA